MKPNAEYFLRKTLGEDLKESLGEVLSKSEVYKQGTRTITDTDDLFQGLQIVPRALLSLLVRELSPMQIGENKEIRIPGKEDTTVQVTKHERDSYSGQIIQNNVKINDFMHRSLPGLGLVLMTMLELYDFEDLKETPSADHSHINKLIDERMHLHSLINQVVDGKLMHRDAVEQLLMTKLNQMGTEHKEIKEEHKEIMKPEEPKATVVINIETAKKRRPLSEFVENRKKKLAKKEHFIEMKKSEEISCPDCGNVIFSEGAYSGCICFGDSDKKLYVKKSENGYMVRPGRGWDEENLEMLLEALRGNKNG